MGKADTITKNYISDPAVFADVFNCYLYGGQQVIRPEQLKEKDSTEIALPYGSDGAITPVQKYRDVQKLCAIKTDGVLEYVLYGTENQSKIHYAMPVRNNLYDALEYAGQVEQAAQSYRKSKTKLDSKEFLSGFRREDKLIPSVTLTIYFGTEDWDGPLSLLDMLEVKDSRILPYLNDYKMNLVAPALMTDDEILKFQSSFRDVMFSIKYSKDKKELERVN